MTSRPGRLWRRTKIICTIGPATAEPDVIRKLILAGMNIGRFNLSHGTHEEHRRYIQSVRQVAQEAGMPVSILIDLPGPKYRTGPLQASEVFLKKGDRFILTTRVVPGNNEVVSVNFPTLTKDIQAGDIVFLDDGALQLKAEEVSGADVICRVLIGGRLTSNRGIAVQDMSISSPYITSEFLGHVDFAVSQKPDFVALSLISEGVNVREAKETLRSGGCQAAVIAKIERRKALTNLAAIMAESDAIMVARGDLGVDMPLYRIPLVQKDIIRCCNRASKPVITATQMLESMIHAARPTRAEVTDVANAIFDGTDAVMLSGETSIGKYPVAAVRMMAAVANQTEDHLPYKDILAERGKWIAPQTDELIAYNACYTAAALGAKVIVAFTTSGSTVRRVAKYRPRIPILAITSSHGVYGQLQLSWGVHGIMIAEPKNISRLFETAVRLVKEVGLAHAGDLIVITGGVPVGVSGTTNLLKVEKIS
jgi:pyruvate kinase